MRIATWNVNSIRARAERVGAWLDRSDCDVLAIQETKCKNEQFPLKVFTDRGYEVAQVGYSQWNGVAIASRVGISDVADHFAGQPGFNKDPGQDQEMEARAIRAVCGGIDVWSLYVPNGRDLTDRHYEYKLDWLAQLRREAQHWLTKDPDAKIALVGDWNVAPCDEDVWDIEEFDGCTHVSAAERDAFSALTETGFVEVTRPLIPGPGVYTYWDYKSLRFPKKQGMRIDFQLHSPALARRVSAAHIDRDERKGKGASDHAPVIVDLA